MLKFFEDRDSCDIVINNPVTSDDIESMERILSSKKYSFWTLTFGHIYIINRDFIFLLYKEIFINKKNIKIVTHKEKLNRYLHRLGFKTLFISLIKEDIIKISNIKIVVIGGSADSSPKIIEFVKNLSLENLTLVIVQHIEAERKELFDKIIQRYTNYSVGYAKDGEELEKSKIYISPKNRHLLVSENRFQISNKAKYNYARPSLSLSYESFSQEYRDKLLIIQECGYLDDGVDKLLGAKKNGSHIVIQNRDECEAKSMIKNAINKDVHDYIFKMDEMIDYLDFLDKRMLKVSCVDYLLKMIYKHYGYDFQLYQREMIQRRLDIFMIKHDITSLKDAIGVILFNSIAFKGFFLEVSINVTEFFRDPLSFEKIGFFIQKSYKNTHHIKIWSAGCSSGKEAYSLAMLLQNLGMLHKSIIYATDFNSVILEEANNAIYSNQAYEKAKENCSLFQNENKFDNFIVKNKNFIAINEEITQKVLFLQHNLAIDSSFNEFDIIICKNVIIYFDYKLQKQVFKLIYDSLKFGGYLILGESERLDIDFRNRFEIVDENSKIYKKVV